MYVIELHKKNGTVVRGKEQFNEKNDNVLAKAKSVAKHYGGYTMIIKVG